MTNVSYKIAMNIYRKLGGEAPSFDNTEDVYNAINDIYASSKGRIDIKPLEMTLTENGQYIFDDTEITGYMPVQVNVDFDTESIHKAGFNEGYDCGIADQKDKLTDITITENGTYTREDGYNNVVVEIETGGGSGAGFDYTPIGYEQSLQNMLNQTTQNHIAYAKERLDYFNSRNTIEAQRFFKDNTQIVFAPKLDLNTRIYQNTSYTSLSSMFRGATNLEIFPGIIGRPYSSASDMFENCRNLRYVGHFDTSNLTTMSWMFKGCTALTTVPLFDTSNVTSMDRMFQGCTALTTVPLFDTSKVTITGYMFEACTALTTVPQFDTSSVTNMGYMFQGCTALTTVPLFDTSKVTNMSYMFYDCTALTTVPLFDTSNATNIGSMLRGCTALTAIPAFDCSNVENADGALYGVKCSDYGGLINLGMKSNLTLTKSKYSSVFYNNGSISHESMLNIVNGLYDRASAGYSNLKLFFDTNSLNRLSDEEKAIATNKGWTLAS